MDFLRNILKPNNEKEVKKESASEKLNLTEEEKILELRESESSRQLHGGCNDVYLVRLKNDGGAVFKPKSGEKHLRSRVREGTHFKRARAAYLVNRFLDFGLVPPTVIRELEQEVGSVQQFVENSEAFIGLSYKDQQDTFSKEQERFTALWIFDIIIWNSDRHTGNLLITNDTIHAIDNDLSFGEDNLRYCRSYYDTLIPPRIIDNLERFVSSPDMKQILRELLLELLSEPEVNACMSRIERIAQLVKKGTITSNEVAILETY